MKNLAVHFILMASGVPGVDLKREEDIEMVNEADVTIYWLNACEECGRCLWSEDTRQELARFYLLHKVAGLDPPW
jgi:hypothetical protein